MGFDDLAKHMASRDGNKKLSAAAGNADQIVAEAAKVDRRMTRMRDLILGPLLLVAGAVVLILIAATFIDASRPNPNRLPDSGTVRFPLAFVVGGLAMVGFGVRQTFRGVRGPR